jgi:hypothetical protein
MISFKDTVVFETNPENLAILHAVSHAYGQVGVIAKVSAGRDGRHMATSKHYYDHAFDVSVRNVPDERIPLLVQDIQARLGQDYQVLFEPDLVLGGVTVRWRHIHVEFDPGTTENQASVPLPG